MEIKEKPQFSVSLSMETIKLPPVSDILVLAKKHPQGKLGVMESFRFIAPDEFEMFESEHAVVEAVLINKRILKRLSVENVLKVLEQYVYPYVSSGEAVKVDFTTKLSFRAITGELS